MDKQKIEGLPSKEEIDNAINVANSELFTLKNYLQVGEMNIHRERFEKMVKTLKTFHKIASYYLNNTDCETHCQELGIAKNMIENLEAQVDDNDCISHCQEIGLLRKQIEIEKAYAFKLFKENMALLEDKKTLSEALIKKSKPELDEALSLIDGCKSIIEIWKPTSPAQEEWKRDWLKKARAIIDQQGK